MVELVSLPVFSIFPLFVAPPLVPLALLPLIPHEQRRVRRHGKSQPDAQEGATVKLGSKERQLLQYIPYVKAPLIQEGLDDARM